MRRLLQGVVAVAGFSICHGAWAQAVPDGVSASAEAVPSEAAPGEVAPGEILVTARRREEKLQDVPISVTAISGAALEQQNISDIYRLQNGVPGLAITGGTQARYQTSFSIRGQRVAESALLTDPPVGLYFAEVVQPRSYGWGFTLYDLQDVQVLKGVQGTLFGRNVTAGAVLVEPAHPNQYFEGDAKVEVGNYNMQSFYGMLNIPVIEDKIALRVNGKLKRRDGFTLNMRTGRDYDNLNYWTGRASVLFTPDDKIENLTIFDIVDNESHGTGTRLTYFKTDACAAPCYVTTLGGTSSAAFKEEYSRYLVGLELGPRKVLGSVFDYDTPLNPYPGKDALDNIRNYGITNKTIVDAGELRFKNIFGYRHLDIARLFDRTLLDTYRNLIAAYSLSGVNVYSNEFQIQGQAFGERLDWTTGVYYLQEKGYEENTSVVLSFLTPNPQMSNAYTGSLALATATSYAAYGAGSFRLGEAWKLSGGLRWNYDKRSVETTNVSFARTSPLPNGQPAGYQCRFTRNFVWINQSVENCKLSRSKSWRAVTWDVSLQFEPSAETNLYLAVRKGFRSGGFPLRPVEDLTFIAFDPEYTLETEVGMKRHWSLDGAGQITTNLALFLQDQTSVQVQLPYVVANTVTTTIVNTGSQKNYGGEFDATMILTNGINISLSYAYVNVTDTVNRPFFDIIGLPKHSVSLKTNYKFPLNDDGTVIDIGGDISYRSLIHLDDLDEEADQNGYALANLYLNFNNINGSGFSTGIFVSNLFNKVYRIGGSFLKESFGLHSSTYGEPRMYGASVRFKF